MEQSRATHLGLKGKRGMAVPFRVEKRGENPRVMYPRSREKRCQPFLYDSPGTLERGTQM